MFEFDWDEARSGDTPTAREHSEEFAAEVAAGRAMHGGIVRYLAEMEKARNLVLERDGAMKAAKLAVEKGVDVRVYLSGLVHEALNREIERAA